MVALPRRSHRRDMVDIQATNPLMGSPLRKAITMVRQVDTLVVLPMALKTEVCIGKLHDMHSCIFCAFQGYPEQQVVYVEEDRKRKKGPGLGTALLAGRWR